MSHDSTSITITLHAQNLRPSNISEEEEQRIQEELVTHCPGLFEQKGLKVKSNKGVVYVVAFAKKCGIPLLTWFVDVYHRHLVSYWITHRVQQTGLPLSPRQFCEQNKFMRELKQISANTDTQKDDLYEIFNCIIPAFHRRLFHFPDAQIQYLYDDSMEEYIEIVQILHHHLRLIAEENDPDDPKKPFPSQLDVLIIPSQVRAKITSCFDDSSESESEEKETEPTKPKKKSWWKKWKKEQKSEEAETEVIECKEIGDIEAELDEYREDGKIAAYIKIKKIPRKNPPWNEIIRDLIRPSSSSTKPKVKMEPNKRYILIIDRRKQHKNIHVWFYEAPQGSNEINSRLHEYLRCINFFRSKSNILPKSRIGLFQAVSGYMFGLSYHINSGDSIAAYWSSHGSAFRFFETDMRDIWPWYFMPTKDATGNDKNQQTKRTHFIEFQDEPFERFYEQITGKRDLYERSVNAQPANQQLSSTQGKEVNAQKVEMQRLQSQWSEELRLAQEYILVNYDEPYMEDVIADLEEGIDQSLILEHLLDCGIGRQRVIQFNDLFLDYMCSQL